MQKGEVAGSYRMLRPLGRGGEGSVWLAAHIRTKQLWAVKEIPRCDGEQEFHELRVMRRFRHAALPRMIDVLETESSVLLVMEYIRGISLEKWRQQKGHLTEEELMEAALCCAGALEYLHTRKPPVLHLDLKPANMIRTREGRVVLVDFGSARRGRKSPDADGTSGERDRRGTIGFAAPEQYTLDQPLTERTDVYGLGATMYYLISGIVYSPALKKGKVPGCTDALGNIIRKSLNENPEERYAGVRELEKAILHLKHSREKRGRRKQAAAAAAVMLLVLLLAGTAVREQFGSMSKEDWNYEEILKEALYVPPSEAQELYKRACFLEPDREEIGRASCRERV